jgi:hypothetical protein
MIFPWIWKVCLCSGLFLIALGLLQSEKGWVRRVGFWTVLATVATGIWVFTGSLGWVAFGTFLWFAVPVIQVLVVSRKMRFSLGRQLSEGSLDTDDFPEIEALTTDLRKFGFDQQGDFWLKPPNLKQGFRLFRHPSEGVICAICVTQHGYPYLLFMSPGRDGSAWLTWDYPLAYVLKIPPVVRVYRYLEAQSVQEILEGHREFLRINEVKVLGPEETGPVRDLLDRILREILGYNLRMGVLRKKRGSDQEIHYSWRGTLFLSFRVLWELILG